MTYRIGAAARAVGFAALALGVSAGTARALTIDPVFDSSITRLANAGTIEQAFRIAAGAYDARLSSPVTVNVNVKWGKVGGYAMPGNALGASVDELYGYFSPSQIESWLPTNDAFPARTATGNRFVLPSAEAKALGLIPAADRLVDGSIGFGLSPANYSFTPGATRAGTYDFIAVAEHELDEVLGRISGIGDGFSTPFDLFRYSKGSPSFSGSAPTYFSYTGGRTQDGPSFNTAYSGDRADWLTTPSSRDVQDAFLYPGTTPTLSQADFDALGVLGYTEPGSGPGEAWASRRGTVRFTLVPEPGSVLLLAVGMGALLTRKTRRRRIIDR